MIKMWRNSNKEGNQTSFSFLPTMDANKCFLSILHANACRFLESSHEQTLSNVRYVLQTLIDQHFIEPLTRER